MNRMIYRMCLAVIIVIALAGGIYYYRTVYREQDSLDNGTFVERMEREAGEYEIPA